jgi:hypothetical protein
VSVLAVVGARNEAGYVEVVLRTLIEEGVEVNLLDDASVDGAGVTGPIMARSRFRSADRTAAAPR